MWVRYWFGSAHTWAPLTRGHCTLKTGTRYTQSYSSFMEQHCPEPNPRGTGHDSVLVKTACSEVGREVLAVTYHLFESTVLLFLGIIKRPLTTSSYILRRGFTVSPWRFIKVFPSKGEKRGPGNMTYYQTATG